MSIDSGSVRGRHPNDRLRSLHTAESLRMKEREERLEKDEQRKEGVKNGTGGRSRLLTERDAENVMECEEGAARETTTSRVRLSL